jgi:thiol-disulfide isomerase/thioredoxin
MTSDSSLNNSSVRLRNFLIVLAAISLSVVLFLSFRTQSLSVSLNQLALKSVPYDTALANGKPTFVEFYANWCTSCQAMVSTIDKVEQQYRDRVNFVMLNVDNNKWLPEVLKYRVDGIPHFVFMDKQGSAIGSAIGEQPVAVLAEDLSALIQEQPLPFVSQTGQTSALAPSGSAKTGQDDPRSHGAQVVN